MRYTWVYLFFIFFIISPIQFFFSTVQHGDSVTHTGIHSFPIIMLHHKWLDLVFSARQQDLIYTWVYTLEFSKESMKILWGYTHPLFAPYVFCPIIMKLHNKTENTIKASIEEDGLFAN